MHRKLTLSEKSSLWLHYAICGPCKDYQQCIEKVDLVAKGGCHSDESREEFLAARYPDDCLTPECRKKFDECIQRELEQRTGT